MLLLLAFILLVLALFGGLAVHPGLLLLIIAVVVLVYADRQGRVP